MNIFFANLTGCTMDACFPHQVFDTCNSQSNRFFFWRVSFLKKKSLSCMNTNYCRCMLYVCVFLFSYPGNLHSVLNHLTKTPTLRPGRPSLSLKTSRIWVSNFEYPIFLQLLLLPYLMYFAHLFCGLRNVWRFQQIDSGLLAFVNQDSVWSHCPHPGAQCRLGKTD